MNGKRKNKGNRLFKGFAILLACVIGISSILGKVPFKKVNADEIPVEYMTYEIVGVNQVRFIKYVLDAYTISDGWVGYEVVYANEMTGELTNYIGSDVEFLRFQSLDIGDYDAYIYNKIYSEREIATFVYIYFDSFHYEPYYEVENPFYFGNVLKNYLRYSEGYDEGFNFGYADGLEEGYGNGLEIGYRDGITEGYAEGFNDGESSQIDVNFMQGIFTSLDAFFQIHFAPNLTIGELFLAPLIIWFVWFIIKQFKGGD